jgi:quinol-cytochrome oxidoreductase complex cytochrome b subunit
MLKSIPHKVAGILTVVFSLLVLFLLPFLNTSSLVKNGNSTMFFKICYFAAIADFLVLGWVGQSPVDEWSMLVGQIGTVYYFVFFTILLPFSEAIETLLILHIVHIIERMKKSIVSSIVNLLYQSLRILFTLLILIGSGSIEMSFQ